MAWRDPVRTDRTPVSKPAILTIRKAHSTAHYDLKTRTNITEEFAVYTTSRGELASSFLTSSLPLEEYVAQLTSHANTRAYAGFNLLLLSPSSSSQDPLEFDGRFVSNGGGGGVITARPLHPEERRCGGVSNGAEAHGRDAWPKVVQGRTELDRAVEEHREGRVENTAASERTLIDRLFGVLR